MYAPLFAFTATTGFLPLALLTQYSNSGVAACVATATAALRTSPAVPQSAITCTSTVAFTGTLGTWKLICLDPANVRKPRIDPTWTHVFASFVGSEPFCRSLACTAAAVTDDAKSVPKIDTTAPGEIRVTGGKLPPAPAMLLIRGDNLIGDPVLIG
jgi:hypothetical protein